MPHALFMKDEKTSEVLVTVRLAHFELGKPVLRSSDACVHKRGASDAFHFVLQLILVR